MLPRDKEPALRKLIEVFLEENGKVNLSAIRDPEAAWSGHVLDSISFLEILPLLEEKLRTQKVFNNQESHPGETKRIEVNAILDIGTGGGFPLLPLAIGLPDTKCHGLDSTGKKLKAIERIAGALGLKNVELHVGRCEDLGHDSGMRAKFDIVTARAVAEIPVLLEYAVPFLRPGGCVVLWKSMSVENELASAEHAEKVLLTTFIHRHTYTLPEPFGTRQLLVFQKQHPTDPRYPRAVGVPKKSPL